VTALLSRVVSQKERGLYMGMQQTYGGVTRRDSRRCFTAARSTPSAWLRLLFFQRDHRRDHSAGFGLDKYARHEPAIVSAPQPSKSEATEELPQIAMAAGASRSVEPET
jgi:hypothetical protein